MSLPSQRKFNLNANKTNPAVSGGLRRSNAQHRKREDLVPLMFDPAQALTFDQSSNSWKRQEFEQDPINQLTYRPDATAATNRNKDKGKRPANMNAWSAKCGGDRSTTTTASKSSSSLNPATASSSQLAGPTRERGKIETDPRKVRWPLIGVKR
ncbi:hypothetical protein AbraIFM66951_003100 [Aspergillus brasiliensis]|uniref:Uncharacterized protein n=1 Tax=Aspergillus brasiliensis TaxID=319629 RepID=A0A9W5YQP8_9EURO|nr:hypothetical protein AbraCBS73388_006416 [Aspergillus brasiliensis]GKZ42951.1 hypothetical protein AbraIFM66951_003100 [Aspergillus brasiliensis]